MVVSMCRPSNPNTSCPSSPQGIEIVNYANATTEQLVSRVNSLFTTLVEFLAAAGCSVEQGLTMTDATEAYYGSSGRGSPQAVRCIEKAAEHGVLKITAKGRSRIVTLTSKGVSMLPTIE